MNTSNLIITFISTQQNDSIDTIGVIKNQYNTVPKPGALEERAPPPEIHFLIINLFVTIRTMYFNVLDYD